MAPSADVVLAAPEAALGDDLFDAPAPLRPAIEVVAHANDGRGGRRLVWKAPQALIVPRADLGLPGFAEAAGALESEGWPVFARGSGGAAWPVGPGTLQVGVGFAGAGLGLDGIYRTMAELVVAALADCGLEAEVGEMPQAFCPGRYDVAVAGRKIAGLSQRWRVGPEGTEAVGLASILVDGDLEAACGAVNAFYARAGSPRRCTPTAATSLARTAAGAPGLERRLVAGLLGQAQPISAGS